MCDDRDEREDIEARRECLLAEEGRLLLPSELGALDHEFDMDEGFCLQCGREVHYTEVEDGYRCQQCRKEGR
tara:strand:+ start:229 stop:444 length:216 start_codon:yes stop_codon:yes gene_type:complete